MLCIFFISGSYAQDPRISVFDRYQGGQDIWMRYTGIENALYHHIAGLAEKCLLERQKNIAQLVTASEWKDYLENKRDVFFSGLEGLEKTPLNARLTGRIVRENYSVDKVVFQSLPGFHVTGCLFVPNQPEEQLPAVLVAIGHSQAAFRRDLYQQNILNLVNKGFVVFTFDPAGQGERVLYPDPETGKSLVGGSTSEHSYAGAQCLLAGYSVNEYFIWDGVRAIDYLVSRPEVDPLRIGMTGISGGGTLTAFLSAYDERILAAAPECYITGYQRLFESIGPQDAEQNFYQGLKRGSDHADLLSLRAPKATMVISATQDFFSIQGARETYAESKDVFTAFGEPENLTMVESDGTHGTSKSSREHMYRFFHEHLNNPGSSEDQKVDYFSEEELTVTPTGQVSSSYNSRSIFDLNKDRVRLIREKSIAASPGEIHQNRQLILDKVKEISGHDASRAIKSVVHTGKIAYQDYKIEKYFIQGENFDYPIPFVFIKPYTDEARPLIVYLDPAGKSGLLSNPEEIASYINKGYSILAPDLLGTGELANNSYKGDSYIKDYSFNIWIGANLVGQSIAGLQSSDLDILYRHIKTRKDVDLKNITVVARNEICSSYLHFAVLNSGIKKTVLVNPVISYEEILLERFYDPRYLWTAVPGAVEFYDMPVLESLLAPSELVIIDPVSAKGVVLDSKNLKDCFWLPEEVYRANNAEDSCSIVLTDGAVSCSPILVYL